MYYYKGKSQVIAIRYKTLVKYNGNIYVTQSTFQNYIQVQSCIEPFVIKQLNINEVKVLF